MKIVRQGGSITLPPGKNSEALYEAYLQGADTSAALKQAVPEASEKNIKDVLNKFTAAVEEASSEQTDE